MFTGIELLLAVVGSVLCTAFACLFIVGATDTQKKSEIYQEGYHRGYKHGYRAGHMDGVCKAYGGDSRDV